MFIGVIWQWFVAHIFNPVFYYPILNLLVGVYKLFLAIHLPGAFGFSLIALVVIVRAILHPFFKQQLTTQKKMQTIKPHLDKLSAKHKDNPKQLQLEQMKLYQEHGINPAAGCVFMIVQIPIFIALYRTLTFFLSNGVNAKVIAEINKLLYFPFLKIQTIDPHFFMFNVALSPAKSHVWYYYLVPVVTAILQYIQAQYQMPQTLPTPQQPVEEGKNKDKKADSSDFQAAMNTQMKYLFPLMIGWFSYTLPVGLSLYYNIFSLFSIIQYMQIQKKTEALALSVPEKKEPKRTK